jgi:hypothetical protein
MIAAQKILYACNDELAPSTLAARGNKIDSAKYEVFILKIFAEKSEYAVLPSKYRAKFSS